MFALVTNNTGYTFRRHRDAQFAELGGKGGELTYRGREKKGERGKERQSVEFTWPAVWRLGFASQLRRG